MNVVLIGAGRGRRLMPLTASEPKSFTPIAGKRILDWTLEAFRQNEVSMLIYHFEGRLFLYATAPSEEHMKRSHPPGVAEKWSAYMATMMVCDEGGQAIVETLEPAFLFGRFAPQA